MVSNSQLKPCPFCGGTVNIMYNSLGHEFHVYHDYEECVFDDFTLSGYYAKSLSEAYELWNKRKGET